MISAPNPRGFTGHEHVDMFDMINMNGRMYDPVLGRFLSPDPFVQAPDNTQGLNRYVYCLNNPLIYVDPSGYSFLSVFKTVVTVAVGIAAAHFMPGIGAAGLVAIIKGAAGGMASGLVGALMNGANVMEAARAGVTGAIWGGLSAGAANGIGTLAQKAGNAFFVKIALHSTSQGAIEGLRGGNFLHGFVAGTASVAQEGALTSLKLDDAAEVIVSATMGGTVSALTGGKFANGAISAAYVTMFNKLMHKRKVIQFHYQEEGQYPVDKKSARTSLYIMKGAIAVDYYDNKITISVSASAYSQDGPDYTSAWLKATLYVNDTEIGYYNLEKNSQGAITSPEYFDVGKATFDVYKSSMNFNQKSSLLLPNNIKINLIGGWKYTGPESPGGYVPHSIYTKSPIGISETFKIR